MKTAHRTIKRFGMDGKVQSSTAFSKVQEMYINLLEEKMRDQGYVPRLDIGMEWTTTRRKSHSDFEISLYGSYVGRKTAWVIDGIDNGRPISIRQSKQSESSKQQEEQSQEK